ncbi:MAG: hypothetical protein HQM04_09075 [Magnetococcales bacterium]|nr:hypothetical protein [Magnetococcales bacterium]MBF0115183.1 hypothetical protein [Magnetococcales bacterium]
MTDIGQIGFSQRIQLSWLEYAANLVLAGNGREAMTKSLQEHLTDKLSVGGVSERGNREKAISILLRIWLTGYPPWPLLRKTGLELLRVLPVQQQLPVHWGMTMAVYPFFGAVAEATGRLLRLQESITSAQVLRRLRERYGERETVDRAVRRVLRVFADWHVLNDTETQGVYRCATNNRLLHNKELESWILVARLIANREQTASLRTLLHHPSLFPFQMDKPTSVAFECWKDVTVMHLGSDDDVLVSVLDTTGGPE